MRLQVLICPTAQGPPEYSFLEISQPALTLEELAASIEARHTKLYPHQPQLTIYKLQDADSNDLDLEYTVGDVFSDKSKDKSCSVVRVIRSMPNRVGSIPPESGLRPQRKHGRQRATLTLQGRGGSHLSQCFTPEDVLDETMLDDEMESNESFQERERKRLKPMPSDVNDEESLAGQSFEQREESIVEEVVPESSLIGAEDSLVWSTNNHQPPNRRLFTKPSSPIHDRNLASSLNKGLNKYSDVPDFRFTRTRRGVDNRVEVSNTQVSEAPPYNVKGTPHPRQFLTNGAPNIRSPGSSIDAKEEDLSSPAAIRRSHSPLLTIRVAPSSITTDEVQYTNGTQDSEASPMASILTQVPLKETRASTQQATTKKLHELTRPTLLRPQPAQSQEASKDPFDIDTSDDSGNDSENDSENESDQLKEKQHHTQAPIETPSTQLLTGLALQESATTSPLSEKTSDRGKATERDARAAAAEARRQKELEASQAKDELEVDDETTDSETEQQMEKELQKVEEKARKEKEEAARRAKEEEARREKEDLARKAKEEEERKAREEAEARKAEEEEARKAKEEEARVREQQEAEKRKAEEAKAAAEVEKKRKAAEAAERKKAAEKKKAEAVAEKFRKKQEQEELKRIEKELKAKEKAEALERKKEERARLKEKEKKRGKKVSETEDTEGNSTSNEDMTITLKASEPPASQGGNKRQRSALNESSSAAEDVPQGKKQKTTKASEKAEHPQIDDHPINPELPPPATPKVVSALRKTSPNGTPAPKTRRSVSFADIGLPVLTPQNSSASETSAKVYAKTPIPPPVLIPDVELTPVSIAKPPAKGKTPIPLPDLGAAVKATGKKAAPVKSKAAEKQPAPGRNNKSKLSQELVESSESESEDALEPSKPVVQTAAPSTHSQGNIEAGKQKKAAGPKDKKEAVSGAREDSDVEMADAPNLVPAQESVPKAVGRVTRAAVGSVLYEPLPRPTRGKKVAETTAPARPPAPIINHAHDDSEASTTSEDEDEDEDGEEEEEEAAPGKPQNKVQEVKAKAVVTPAVAPVVQPASKPSIKSSSPSSETESETETSSPEESESESDDEPHQPTSTPRAPSPKARQIASNLTKALGTGRAITNEAIKTPTASQQIPPSSQPATPFLPPSSQKYKSLSQLAVEEDYPEVTPRLSSQVTKKKEPGSDSDDEDEEESSPESESGSGSESSSGADAIPKTKRAGGASADKKKSGGRSLLGGFLNRRKSSQSTR